MGKIYKVIKLTKNVENKKNELIFGDDEFFDDDCFQSENKEYAEQFFYKIKPGICLLKKGADALMNIFQLSSINEDEDGEDEDSFDEIDRIEDNVYTENYIRIQAEEKWNLKTFEEKIAFIKSHPSTDYEVEDMTDPEEIDTEGYFIFQEFYFDNIK